MQRPILFTCSTPLPKLVADYHLPINLGDPQLPNHTAPVEPRAVTRGRVAPLRGATVDVDSRRVGQILLAVLLAALTIVVVVLFVAGAHRNSQISNLKTRCRGRRHGDQLHWRTRRERQHHRPIRLQRHVRTRRKALQRPNSRRQFATAGTAVPLSPQERSGLIATSRQVQSEHTSWNAFIYPIVLLFVLVVIVVAVVVRRRKKSLDVG